MYLIFDFDGTLVDSEPGIREAFIKATNQISPQHLSIARLVPIGPPLEEVARQIFHDGSKKMISDFIELFKEIYDSEGYLKIEPYADATFVLERLNDLGHILSIATNKRGIITRKIISYLKWDKYFSAVCCLDEFENKKLGKAAMVSKYLKSIRDINQKEVVYIGDTWADFKVASFNNINFIFATYGYENFPLYRDLDSAIKIENLKNIFEVI